MTCAAEPNVTSLLACYVEMIVCCNHSVFFASFLQEEKFSLLTGETPESLHEGKLVICTVVGIVRRKPPREVLDRANPIQNEQTHLWQCPFCLLDNFRDLGHVS